jgi:hypothetical protein
MSKFNVNGYETENNSGVNQSEKQQYSSLLTTSGGAHVNTSDLVSLVIPTGGMASNK